MQANFCFSCNVLKMLLKPKLKNLTLVLNCPLWKYLGNFQRKKKKKNPYI